MNTFRYNQDQRQSWVLEKLNGTKSVKRICREAGISRATLYNWIEEFPDQKVAAIQLKEEEALALPITFLSLPEISLKKSSAGKYEMLLKALTQSDEDGVVRKKLVQLLVKRFTLTVAAACELVALPVGDYGYRPRKPEADDRLVYDAITTLLEADNTRTFEDCCRALQQEHPTWPRKQVKRLWSEKKLYQQRARKLRGPVAVGAPQEIRLQRPGACWRCGLTTIAGATLLFLTDEEDGALLNAKFVSDGQPEKDALISLFVQASIENGAPRKIMLAGREPFNIRDVTVWVWEQKFALQTLSMGKQENEASFSALEEKIQIIFRNAALNQYEAADNEELLETVLSGSMLV